jgi:CO/xanthine dehydrogenase FAD-binding subunit
LDGWAELRRQGKSRWAPLGQLRDRNGSMRINETELVTRIKIPPREWTHWMLRTFGSPFPPGLPSLTLAGAAIMDKTGIHEFRFSVVIDGRAQIRLREAETDLAGRAVPLTERDRRAVMSALEDHEFYGSRLDDLGRWRAGNGLREFLLSLG